MWFNQCRNENIVDDHVSAKSEKVPPLTKQTHKESKGRKPSCRHVVLKGGTGCRRTLVGGIFCTLVKPPW